MELDEELRQIVAAFNGGKKDDAIARLNTYVQANPDSTVAFAILFEFYQAKGEMEKVRRVTFSDLTYLQRLASSECRRWRSNWPKSSEQGTTDPLTSVVALCASDFVALDHIDNPFT